MTVMTLAAQPLPPGDDPLPLRITRARFIAEGCRLIELAHADGLALPPVEPGAHIGLVLPNGLERQYSLIESGADLSHYRIVVKRDAATRGGSAQLCDRAQVGDVMMAERPRNNFALDESAPATVFIAGGIGVTPIWAMVQRLEAIGAPWTLAYAARNRAEAPFREELSRHPQVRFHFDDEDGGLLPIAQIVAAAPPGAHLYCCGPAPMLAAFEAAAGAAGIPDERVHVEYFTQKYAAATEGGFAVVLARSGDEVRVQPGQTILDALREIGVEVPSACEEGICGACETRVIEGVPDHRDAILSEEERQANQTIFVCCSGARSDRLVLDI